MGRTTSPTTESTSGQRGLDLGVKKAEGDGDFFERRMRFLFFREGGFDLFLKYLT